MFLEILQTHGKNSTVRTMKSKSGEILKMKKWGKYKIEKENWLNQGFDPLKTSDFLPDTLSTKLLTLAQFGKNY